MTMISLERSPLGLVTDLYQLTMAAGYRKSGLDEREAVFHLFFRHNPFGGGYSLACGLAQVVDFLQRFGFDDEDVAYLETLRGNDSQALFDRGFLDFLNGLRFSCDVDVVPEGTVVFPLEPLLRIRGPLVECQILETALLTILNFQTLIATKASRVCQAAAGDPVLEFGLRRAQGLDGGLSASRAAYVGGCVATSNVLAGRRLGIPVKGTHAHSWVMSFASEEEAFEAYARALPNNCIFLVDTYETLGGIDRAIESARRLRAAGHEMIGIRLDSGDLCRLSIEARRKLDAAGFPEAQIVASNDLDERSILELKAAGARIGVWGVGTKLATAYDQPALGGVFKLSAFRDAGGEWTRVLKLSEEPVKVSNPGIPQVRRFQKDGRFLADVIYDELEGISDPCVLVDAEGRESALPDGADGEDLLVPVTRGGASVYRQPALDTVRERAQRQLGSLDDACRRFERPAIFPVGLDLHLYRLKEQLIRTLQMPTKETEPCR